MVTENECKQSLRNLENINLDIVLDELGYEKAEEVSVYGINDYPTLEKQGDIDVLKELIKEHFSNPPLEWEELKECNVVYDKEEKKYRLIEDFLENGKRIVFTNTIDSFITENYEPNRFYRKEIKDVD